jgi:putative ABC transport system ATP-binding protein
MIQVEAVTKTFRSGRRRVRALADISLSVAAGSFAAFMGRSGSGKTTLMHCMGGIEAVGEGRIICFGVEVTALAGRELSLYQRHNLGFVFQHGNLLSCLTVAENIGFPPGIERDRRPFSDCTDRGAAGTHRPAGRREGPAP